MTTTGSKRPHGPLPSLPTRRVMARLIVAGALFASTIIYVSSGEPRLTTTGFMRDQISLNLRDATPASARVLTHAFIPAAAREEKKVLRKLASLGKDWQARGLTVSVTPMEFDDGAVKFAQQMDGWLESEGLSAAEAFLNEDMGEVSHPPMAHGLVIRCHENHRADARDLLLALSPMMRGSVSIEFTQRAEPGQMDIYIEGAPSFNPAGVAYFPALDADA